MTLLLIWFGLIVGNVLGQAVTNRSFETVMERSFFQGIALLAVALFK